MTLTGIVDLTTRWFHPEAARVPSGAAS
jgi:hypothetical protein